MQRNAAFEQLRRETFDVLILGSGINGAGLARDLALRSSRAGLPLRIALVEKNGFASGTSSRNSQLVHGGLRYLKYFDIKLVKEALRERAILLAIAPHVVAPLGFLMPAESWFDRAFYGLGVHFYDQLAGRHSLGKPHYEKASKSWLYWDARMHAARLVLDNLAEAQALGAVAVNYVEASTKRRDGAAWKVALKDTLTGESFETAALSIADTTGAWQVDEGVELRLVRGSHLVVPRIEEGDYARAWFGSDGRIVFFIPWGENEDLTLIGTTDEDHTDGPDKVHIARGEVDYLIAATQKVFGKRPEIISAYSSLRPLVPKRSGSAIVASREHRIWRDQDGTLHVAGGKYTTYRAMMCEAADLILDQREPRLAGSRLTETTPVNGNFRFAVEDALRGIPAAMHSRMRPYGARAGTIWKASDKAGLAMARIDDAIENDGAMALLDLLFVSTYWGYERRWDASSLCVLADYMGGKLGWDEPRMEREVATVLQRLELPA